MNNNHQSHWSSGVAWLARTTDNREVAGSNPAWTINYGKQKQIEWTSNLGYWL